jgi:predicted ATP-grasp superfamily ATP-dependent carboligase/GNAT superfamily N-acetyltransferase
MNIYKHKSVVLGISGNGLGIVRSLGRRGIEVVVVSDTDSSANLFSRYITDKWFFDDSENALVEELIKRGSSFQEKPVLFPVRDATVLALADRLEEIRRYYHLVMPGSGIVRRALCKTGFYQLASELGLAVPQSYSAKCLADISSLSEKLKYPVIVKPEYRNDEYISNVSGKAFIAESRKELIECYGEFSPYQAEAVIQEYIPGSDANLYFCFQYYQKDLNLVASLCGRKIRQYPPSSGSTSSCEVVNNSEVEKITTSFFKAISYVGPCSMELKEDTRDGRYYLIEPTVGRLDWNNAFAEGNGLPIAFMNYLDALDQLLPEFVPRRFPRRWVRWSADRESVKIHRINGDLSLLGWIWSIRPPVTGAIFAFDDPAPSVVGCVRKIKRKISSLGFRLKKKVRKKLKKIYTYEIYTVFDKDVGKGKFPDVSGEFIFKEAMNDDIPEFVQEFKSHYGENASAYISKRINSGDFLILGYMKGSPDVLCSFSWLSSNDPFFLEKQKVRYRPDEICSCRVYVKESFRNKGISSSYRRYAEAFALNKGYTNIISFVRTDNAKQLKVLKNSGCIETGCLWRKVVCGHELIKLKLIE